VSGQVLTAGTKNKKSPLALPGAKKVGWSIWWAGRGKHIRLDLYQEGDNGIRDFQRDEEEGFEEEDRSLPVRSADSTGGLRRGDERGVCNWKLDAKEEAPEQEQAGGQIRVFAQKKKITTERTAEESQGERTNGQAGNQRKQRRGGMGSSRGGKTRDLQVSV